jgi:glycosyltransferase involved in cell wall biosynthesis
MAFDKLIDVFLLKSNESSSNIKVWLIGDFNFICENDIIAYIKVKIIEDDVEFVGFVEGESKSQSISNAIRTVLVFNSENFGNSVLESLVYGTPFLTSTGTPLSMVED